MWAVALPAVVADTSNPVKALGRSRALTKGNRWRIFGLVLLFWILILVLEAVFFGGLGAAGAFPGRRGASFLSIAVVSLFSFLFSLCISVGSASSACLLAADLARGEITEKITQRLTPARGAVRGGHFLRRP